MWGALISAGLGAYSAYQSSNQKPGTKPGPVQQGVNQGIQSGVSDAIGRGTNALNDWAFGGAPTSASGAQLGQDARDYYNNAFPGTNPWEHLGSSNPAGPVEIADKQIKTQRRNVDQQVQAQKSVAQENNATVRAAAEMKGREEAVRSGAVYGADAVYDYGEYITKGKPPMRGDVEASRGGGTYMTNQQDSRSRQKQANAALSNAEVQKGLEQLKNKAHDLTVAEMMKDPISAAMKTAAARMYEVNKNRKDLDQLFNDYYQVALAAGYGKQFMSKLTDMFSVFVGDITGMTKPAGRRPSSAPGTPKGRRIAPSR